MKRTEIPEDYKKAIYNAYRGVIQIERPNVSGFQNNLFFIKTNDGDYVAKFGSRDMILKNVAAAQLLARHNIPVPDTHIANIGTTWVEHYPMIPGQTLHERILDGMSPDAVRRAYEDILMQFIEMEQIPTEKFARDAKPRVVHNMAYENIRNTNGTTMASIMQQLIRMLNIGHKDSTGVHHFDITPKNVIVDGNGHLVSFLDLDSVSIGNRSFAFAVMADKWTELGYDRNQLYDTYEYLSGHSLNRGRINAMLNMVHFGKFMMFHAHKHKVR